MHRPAIVLLGEFANQVWILVPIWESRERCTCSPRHSADLNIGSCNNTWRLPF
jgi:hypothetical protein